MDGVFWVIWGAGLICLMLITDPYNLSFWQQFGIGGLWMSILQLFAYVGGH